MTSYSASVRRSEAQLEIINAQRGITEYKNE